ncbi:response regulator transcription factor [Listeria ilorinensis]|uniref:response regulator transcription factor n=1 Tax=Listeria ilorinensis TaxID=2867439 RepID=UPI001EF74CAC|nr:response regulator [Listeria ilorinensis]
MHQVLIIDDEKIIRNGLKQFIEKEAAYFEVCGLAKNADEAMQLNEALRPHVALIDINMPGMNGLDLARVLKSANPALITVIISGYDDFEYARQAIQLHMFDYLLKPVPRSDLLHLFNKLSAHLESLVSESDDVAAASGLSPVISALKTYLDEHYADHELTIQKAAQNFNSSPAYLSRRMKKELGASFLEYLTEIRIQKAKELLTDPFANASVGEIATKVGFKNIHYFSRVFKKRTGLAPVEYRRQL